MQPKEDEEEEEDPCVASPVLRAGSRLFVLAITGDNCHVMKLRICRIYGDATLPRRLSGPLALYGFKPVWAFVHQTKGTQTICGGGFYSVGLLFFTFTFFSLPFSLFPSSNYPHSFLLLQ